MHRVGVEVTGMGALKLTGFLREKMQQKNLHFDSLYTVRALKEVPALPAHVLLFVSLWRLMKRLGLANLACPFSFLAFYHNK